MTTLFPDLFSRCSAEAHLQLLSEQLPVFFWTTDLRLRINSHWGRGFLRRKGPQSSAIGRSVADYFRCSDSALAPLKQHIDALLGVSSRSEFRRRTRIYDMSVEPFRSPENQIVGCIGLALDITERKKSEEHMLHQATHDGLTGLLNYRAFFDSLEREVLRCERTRATFALLLMDVNELKSINDHFGHLAGNRALKRLARVLKESCRASDLVARFGGDEFAVLLIDSDQSLANQISARVGKTLEDDLQHPPLRVSLGISGFPQDGACAQDLFEIADQRLYANKKASRVQAFSAVAGTSEFSRLR